jgi:WhiB family transcriptional regulator, redox-sensing transcriptional regulator
MGQPARNSSPNGYPVHIPTGIASAVAIRTASTPRASRSTERRWVSADLVQIDAPTIHPDLEERVLDWSTLFPHWHTEARCRTVEKPNEMFFGESDDHTHTSLTITKIQEVKAFCKACPVFIDCLTHSLTTPERHGIWAGTSKRTRMRILALIHAGRTTVTTVVEDYVEGRERKYESIRGE